jgi:hypothetical protein
MGRSILYIHVISIAIIYSGFAEDTRPNVVVIMADDLVSYIRFIYWAKELHAAEFILEIWPISFLPFMKCFSLRNLVLSQLNLVIIHT